MPASAITGQMPLYNDMVAAGATPQRVGAVKDGFGASLLRASRRSRFLSWRVSLSEKLVSTFPGHALACFLDDPPGYLFEPRAKQKGLDRRFA
jgi:hypothetical protein